MLSRIRRSAARLAATAVVGGLAFAAGAEYLDGGLIIVAPVAVQGGFPICGYVTGTTPETCVTAIGQTGPLSTVPNSLINPDPNAPLPGCDPLYYAYATTESMAPGFATIYASDTQHHASAVVSIY